MDYGPFLIQLISHMLAIGFFLRFIDKPDFKYAYAASFLLGISLNDKIISLPCVVAQFISVLIVLIVCGKFKLSFIKQIPAVLFCLIIGTIPFSYFLIRGGIEPMFRMVYGGGASEQTYAMKLKDLFVSFYDTVNSDVFLFVSTGDTHVLPLINKHYVLWPFYAIALGFFCLVYEYSNRKSSSFYKMLFLFLNFICSFLLQAFVTGLNRPWHIFVLYPALLLILGYGITIIFFQKKIFYRFISLLIIVMLFFQFEYAYRLMQNSLDTSGFNLSSPGIREVVNRLVLLKPKKVALLNYSLTDPIFVLSGAGIKVQDLTWWDKNKVKEYLNTDSAFSHLVYRVPVDRLNNPADMKFLSAHNGLLDEVNNFNVVYRTTDAKGTKFVILEKR